MAFRIASVPKFPEIHFTCHVTVLRAVRFNLRRFVSRRHRLFLFFFFSVLCLYFVSRSKWTFHRCSRRKVSRIGTIEACKMNRQRRTTSSIVQIETSQLLRVQLQSEGKGENFPSASRGPVSREKVSRSNWPVSQTRRVDERFKETPASLVGRKQRNNGPTSEILYRSHLSRNRLPKLAFSVTFLPSFSRLRSFVRL